MGWSVSAAKGASGYYPFGPGFPSKPIPVWPRVEAKQQHKVQFKVCPSSTLTHPAWRHSVPTQAHMYKKANQSTMVSDAVWKAALPELDSEGHWLEVIRFLLIEMMCSPIS